MVFCFVNLAAFISAFHIDGHLVCLQLPGARNKGEMHIVVYTYAFLIMSNAACHHASRNVLSVHLSENSMWGYLFPKASVILTVILKYVVGNVVF